MRGNFRSNGHSGLLSNGSQSSAEPLGLASFLFFRFAGTIAGSERFGLDQVRARRVREERPMGAIQDDNDKDRKDDDRDIVLDPRIQDAIGKSLKAHYDDLIKAPMPDRFLVLLAELEAKERRNGQ
ncbi:MAG: NepR family anti-sigma factor [Phreatobacter sp.]|nr:NepR family anti-sigma factor [Phreatobacter sp.]